MADRRHYELRYSGALGSNPLLGTFQTAEQAFAALDAWKVSNPRWNMRVELVERTLVERPLAHPGLFHSYADRRCERAQVDDWHGALNAGDSQDMPGPLGLEG